MFYVLHTKGMGAEIVEIQGLQQGQQSDSEDTQEAISENNSGHFAKRLDQALGGELTTSGFHRCRGSFNRHK